MKYLLSLLLIVLCLFHLSAQSIGRQDKSSSNVANDQIVAPYAQAIPANKVLILRPDTIVQPWRVTVASCYVGQYPESVFQYQQYLNELLVQEGTTAYAKALPDSLFLKQASLDEEAITFFRGDYLNLPEFSNYPIFGLSYDQIERYFQWKTRELVLAYLEFSGACRDLVKDGLSIEELHNECGGVSSIPIPSYRLLTQAEMLSALKANFNQRIKPISTPFHSWLTKQPDYQHLIWAPSTRKLTISSPFLTDHGIYPVYKGDFTKVKKQLRQKTPWQFTCVEGRAPLNDESVSFELYTEGIAVQPNGKLSFVGLPRYLLPIRFGVIRLNTNMVQPDEVKGVFSTF